MAVDGDRRRSRIAGWRDGLLQLVEYEGNRRLRRLGTALFRRTKGRIGPRKRHVMLLTTRGRRSGHEHTVLLQHFPDDDGVLVVAANSGRASHPDWYLNLVAGSPVRVEAGGRSWSASAEELPPAEAAAAWVRILHRAPAYARYRRTTARAIPILRLRWAGCGQPE